MPLRRTLRSFRWQLLLLVGGLVVLAQAATFTGVLTVLDEDVRRATAHQLDGAAALVSDTLRRRAERFGNGADVLVADFGLRSAIGSGDRETIRSALENNVGRIGADFAVLHAPDGRAIIATERAHEAAGGMPPALTDGHAGARKHRVGALGGLPWQSFVVPVRAPTIIARLALGFALDGTVAQELADQVGVQVSFGIRDGVTWHHPVTVGNGGTAVLDPQALAALPDTGAAVQLSLAGTPFMVRTVTLADSAGSVRVVLQRSLADALGPYYTLRNQLALITALTLTFGILAAWWLAHSLSKPLITLVGAARRIETGDYATPTDIERHDEIGALARAFDTMRTTISEREARITHLATHDELTGLPNRRAGLDGLELALERAGRDGGTVLAVVTGIDNLSRIVDTLGRPVGDAVVVETARRLSDRLRESDSIARIGDDTFLVVLPGVALSGAGALVRGVAETIRQPLSVGEATVTPALSTGLAAFPDDAQGAQELLQRAGIALADARELNLMVASYAEGRDESMRRQLSIVGDLKRAVDRDELILHYQPKVSTCDGQVRAVEALVRWIHPVHGFMPPDEFISLAESSGNVSMLSDWVIDRAARQSAAWRTVGRHIAIAVNLSALDLRDERLVERIVGTLERYELDPDALVIEITESAVVEDAELALSTLNRLRVHGMRISIDDFGTGHSSLAKLADLPADELKIDRAFVIDIKPDTPAAMIVQAIVELGHGLGMTVVTEGVETLGEQTLIAALGADSVQGYFHSRPLLPDALGEWLDHRGTSVPEAA